MAAKVLETCETQERCIPSSSQVFLQEKKIWFLVYSKHGCFTQLLQLGELKLLNVEHLGLKFLKLESLKYSVCNLKFFSSHSSLFQHKGWQAVFWLTWLLKATKKEWQTSQHKSTRLAALCCCRTFLGEIKHQLCDLHHSDEIFSRAGCLHAVQDMDFLFMPLRNTWMLLCKIMFPTKEKLNPVSTVHLLSHLEIIERCRKLES